MVQYALLRTVLDPMLAVAGPGGLARLEFLPKAWEYHIRAHAIAREIYPEEKQIKETPRFFDELHGQLADYFVGRRSTFTIDLHLVGSEFQVKVWTQLLKISYGKLRTYGQVARAMRKPTAFRAVGQAAGHNPLPILDPLPQLPQFPRSSDERTRILNPRNNLMSHRSRLHPHQLGFRRFFRLRRLVGRLWFRAAATCFAPYGDGSAADQR